MIVGCNLPPNISWTAGAAGVFSTDIKLSTPNPGEVTRITHLGGSPAYITLDAQWSAAQPIRLLMVVGLAYLAYTPGSPDGTYTWAPVPAGVSVTATGKRAGDTGFPYALGGNSTTALTRTLPNGTTAVYFVLNEDLTDLIGVRFTVSTTLDATTWLGTSDELEVGGAYPFTGVEVPGAPGWTQSWVDPTLKQRTLAGQLNIVVRQSWREYDINIPAGTEAEARSAGLQEGFDYETLANALRYCALCAVVPYWKDENGVFDAVALHRNGMVGTAEPKALTHVEKRYFSHGYKFSETPALEDLS